MKTLMITSLACLAILTSCGGSASSDKVEDVYQCPMHCEGEKTYNKPGPCPVCGMDLQKVEATSSASEANH